MELGQPLSGEVPPHETAADIYLEKAVCRVVPGETARFPFTVRTAHDAQAIDDLDVVSANPNFNRAWAHIVGSAEGPAVLKHYVLEVRPADIHRRQYGEYPLLITWGAPGTQRFADSQCVLVIKPCVRLTAQPVIAVRPTGKLSLSLENCGSIDIDVSVTLTHHGTNWSKGWDVELGAEDGPFEFSEQFELPPQARKGEFDLGISAEGIPLVSMKVRPRRLFIARKHITTAAVALAGIAAATTFALIGSAADPQPQKITFTSELSAVPVPGGTYTATASGGGSGNPVTLGIDPPSAPVCSISGSTVTFTQAGSCVIDANQAGNDKYQAAPEAQQLVTVNGGRPSSGNSSGGTNSTGGSSTGNSSGGSLTGQTITFTSAPQGPYFPGDTYQVAATGGGSGNQVKFSIDPASASVCSAAGSTVTFNQPGSCVIDASQAGSAQYQAATQVQQTVRVNSTIPQTITFTSTPQGPYFPADTYQVAATGGGSGNQVKFSIDPASTSVCSATGSTVTFNQPGSCVIDASQAGDAHYQAATQAKQTVTVVNPLPQTITLTPGPAKLYSPGDTYQVTVTGGESGNPVKLSIDDSSSTWACSISDPTVTSGDKTTVTIGGTSTLTPPLTTGKCVIDANQARGGNYQAAPQRQETLNVSELS